MAKTKTCKVCGSSRSVMVKGRIQGFRRVNGRLESTFKPIFCCKYCYAEIINYRSSVFEGKDKPLTQKRILGSIKMIRRVKDPLIFYHLVCERMERELIRGIVHA